MKINQLLESTSTTKWTELQKKFSRDMRMQWIAIVKKSLEDAGAVDVKFIAGFNDGDFDSIEEPNRGMIGNGSHFNTVGFSLKVGGKKVEVYFNGAGTRLDNFPSAAKLITDIRNTGNDTLLALIDDPEQRAAAKKKIDDRVKSGTKDAK